MASEDSEEIPTSKSPANRRNVLNKDELVSEDGRNIKWVLCPYCDSKVLQPNKGQYMEEEFVLPLVSAKNQEPAESERETLSQFWLVLDMFTFENVGFSKTVNTTKYLICADCEIGPIGFLNTEDRTKHYIALCRVKHQ